MLLAWSRCICVLRRPYGVTARHSWGPPFRDGIGLGSGAWPRSHDARGEVRIAEARNFKFLVLMHSEKYYCMHDRLTRFPGKSLTAACESSYAVERCYYYALYLWLRMYCTRDCVDDAVPCWFIQCSTMEVNVCEIYVCRYSNEYFNFNNIMSGIRECITLLQRTINITNFQHIPTLCPKTSSFCFQQLTQNVGNGIIRVTSV